MFDYLPLSDMTAAARYPDREDREVFFARTCKDCQHFRTKGYCALIEASRSSVSVACSAVLPFNYEPSF
jgi:hypothetical protein